MREIFIAALVLSLCGCASERNVTEEKQGRLSERWHGRAEIPLPTPQPDGTMAWEPKKVTIDLTRDQRTLESSKSHEEALTRADVEQIVKTAMTVVKPVAQAASGNWLGIASDVSGWALAAIAGAKAVHSQVKSGTMARAFKQTVDGLKSVRSSIGEDAWKSTVAPHLAKAQDEHVRKVLVPKAESTG